MDNTSVILAEDHAIVRKGLRSLLKEEEGIKIEGEAENGREALELVEKYRPEIVIMDITMPGLNGIEATKLINERYPETKVLVLTRHSKEEYVFEALKAGASGYIVKEDLPEELTSAVRTVTKGNRYFSPSITTKIVDKLLEEDGGETENLGKSPLTSREREVLQLIAEGNTNREIAEILTVSKKTVGTHRSNLMEKLDIHNVADLTKYAIEAGIIETDLT
ncbi:response regulator transcription factor [Candidatus Bipolaricaulota bacterium]|nr:response regulator transcription factor [Candidatus Bipolaricaulota bacterium]